MIGDLDASRAGAASDRVQVVGREREEAFGRRRKLKKLIFRQAGSFSRLTSVSDYRSSSHYRQFIIAQQMIVVMQFTSKENLSTNSVYVNSSPPSSPERNSMRPARIIQLLPSTRSQPSRFE